MKNVGNLIKKAHCFTKYVKRRYDRVLYKKVTRRV